MRQQILPLEQIESWALRFSTADRSPPGATLFDRRLQGEDDLSDELVCSQDLFPGAAALSSIASGVKLFFAPAMMVIGVMAMTSLINVITMGTIQLLDGESSDGAIWLTPIASTSILAIFSVIAFVALYASVFTIFIHFNLMMILIGWTVMLLHWLMGWIGDPNPDTTILGAASAVMIPAAFMILGIFVPLSHNQQA